MQQKITDRIMQAVIYGGNPAFTREGVWAPAAHPLSKAECERCGEMVMEKERKTHQEKHER